jgi:phosphatidylserine/phosphatidylglycerophosphate/cardiolipin synthase-like enzyme/regulation of enolase protein 1 (concanavalin A-like superfamily)
VRMGTIRRWLAGLSMLLWCVSAASSATAMERLCDTAFEDCRAPLRQLIQNETQGIDVAFWFMTDARYAADLIERWRAGVPVRVIMDTRATQPGHAEVLERLREAGVPMRQKTSSGIVHWKMMLFAGQNVVQFSGANYSSQAFVPIDPFRNYVDEVIYFTSRASIVNSFRTRFDDVWTSTAGYDTYANVSEPLQRRYATFPIDPELNFPPWQSFRSRSVARYRAETQGVDAIIYRITDRAHTDALIEAIGRGVSVRILTEPLQYRDPSRLWHAWNVDRLWAAGAQFRHRLHQGLIHQKLTLLTGQRMSVFGSSNWTGPSSDTQLEHNLFTTDPGFYEWSRQHFDRKWHNTGPVPETQPFLPLPPDRPELQRPEAGAVNQPATVTLAWYAGPWAHRYDVYLGKAGASPVKVVDDLELGPSERVTDWVTWTLTDLEPGATYTWHVVSRTMAGLERTSESWNFSVDARAPVTGSALPGGWSRTDVGSPLLAGSSAHSNGRFTVHGTGRDIWGTSDQFHYAYRTLTGNGAIEARVTSVQGPEGWTKAGVMLRESTSAGSRHASLFVTLGQGLAFQRRATTGGQSAHTLAGTGTAPAWVRLERRGDQISAYVSANGSSWTLIETVSVPMPQTILVGLAVSSRDPQQPAMATFEHVAVASLPETSPPPTPAPPPPAPPPAPAPSPPVASPDGTPTRYAVPRSGDWSNPPDPPRGPDRRGAAVD